MKYISLFLLIFILSACNLEEAGTSSLALSPGANIHTLPMRWHSSKLPLQVIISNDFISEFSVDQDDANGYNLIQQMQYKWNQAPGGRTYFNLSTDYNKSNLSYSYLEDYLDSEVGIYKNVGWFNNVGSGVLAVTSYLAANRGSYLEMLHGDIVVNYGTFSFTNDENDGTSAYDLPSVLLHELGHLIGLKHTPSSTIPSVMQPTLGRHDVKRSLYQYDGDTLNSLYTNAFLTPKGLSITAADAPTYVQGYIELHASGECRHYQNGKLTNTHLVKIK